MLNKKLLLLIVFSFSLFLIGCRTAPVMEIADAPINTSSGKVPSLSLVTNEIIDAGIALGWQMKKIKQGHIVGTLHLRKHMIKVDIIYSTQQYSIKYKDSSNMKYDGDNIHSNYNNWVQNLSKGIQTQVYNSGQ